MSMCALSLAEAAADIREGRSTSAQLVDDCLKRIAEVDDAVQAWAFLDRDHAMRQAEAADLHRREGKATGPLHGVPIGIKDLFDTGDMPTEFGSPLWAGRTPRRDAFAGASGTNVRDYPLTSGTLLVELPARTALTINGRVMIQGEWWYRIVLEDGRAGFVHQSAIAWGSPPAPPATQAANITAVDPPVAATAGGAGAKIRSTPSRSGRVLVRVASGAALTITGKRRIGEHWWYRVRTAEGQEGFARDDVLTAPGGGALSL